MSTERVEQRYSLSLEWYGRAAILLVAVTLSAWALMTRPIGLPVEMTGGSRVGYWIETATPPPESLRTRIAEHRMLRLHGRVVTLEFPADRNPQDVRKALELIRKLGPNRALHEEYIAAR